MDLRSELSVLNTKKQDQWRTFFDKYSENSDDHDNFEYSIESVPENFIEKDVENAELELKLVTLIEGTLSSNLKNLILRRERAKILMDQEDYDRIHPTVKKELCRLRRADLTWRDLVTYLTVIMKPRVEVIDTIENKLKSKLKCYVLKQMRAAEESCDSHLEECNQLLKKEWYYIRRIVPENDVIRYAVTARKLWKSTKLIANEE